METDLRLDYSHWQFFFTKWISFTQHKWTTKMISSDAKFEKACQKLPTGVTSCKFQSKIESRKPNSRFVFVIFADKYTPNFYWLAEPILFFGSFCWTRSFNTILSLFIWMDFRGRLRSWTGRSRFREWRPWWAQARTSEPPARLMPAFLLRSNLGKVSQWRPAASLDENPSKCRGSLEKWCDSQCANSNQFWNRKVHSGRCHGDRGCGSSNWAPRPSIFKYGAPRKFWCQNGFG